MPVHETHEHDVLIIGAGGAGLRAAIEASAAGRVGGPGLQVAARQGPHGHGRGGHGGGDGPRRRSRQLEGPLLGHHARRPVPQQLADGRAARQGGARSRARAGGLGRRLRSHQGRPHPAAQLRRPPLPAAGARRRSHRPGDDPHAARPRRPPGLQGLHGAHDHQAVRRRRAHRRRVRLRPRARQPARLQGQGHRAGHRRRRPRLQDHQQQLGVHRRRLRAGLRRGRRSDGHGVHPVPPDRDGLAAVGEGHPGDGGGARRGRRPAQQGRQALHVRRHPRQLQSADRRQRGRGLEVHPGGQELAPPARAAHPRPRGAQDHERGARGARQPARRRVPGHRLDQGAHPQGGRAHQEEAPQHVPPVQGAGGHRHHRGAHGGRPDHPLHDGRRARRRRLADVDGAGPVRGGRVRRRASRRQSPGRKLAVGPAGVRQAGR